MNNYLYPQSLAIDPRFLSKFSLSLCALHISESYSRPDEESFEPFQCQSSSDRSGLVYTPNIHDSYFNPVNFMTGGRANFTGSANGVAYFFTLPAESVSRNCSGDVVSIQYCYRARYNNITMGTSINVFNLLDVDRNGTQFTVINSTIIQTTSNNSICTDPPGNIQQICCDTTPLSGLQIPSSEYTFGIVITNANVRPLAFADTRMEYHVYQFRISPGSTRPSPGSTVTGVRVTGNRAVLRFNIGVFSSYVDNRNRNTVTVIKPGATATIATAEHGATATIATAEPGATATTTPTEHGATATYTSTAEHGVTATTIPTEHGATVTTSTTEHGATVTTIPTEHGATVTTSTTEHGATVTTSTTEPGTTVTTSTTEHGATVTTSTTEHGATVTNSTTEHGTTVTTSTTEHEVTVTTSTTEHGATVTTSTTEHGATATTDTTERMITTEPIAYVVEGAVGGSVFLFIIMAIIVCVVVVLIVLVKHRKFRIEEDNATSYNNAIYGVREGIVDY